MECLRVGINHEGGVNGGLPWLSRETTRRPLIFSVPVDGRAGVAALGMKGLRLKAQLVVVTVGWGAPEG